MIFSKNGKFVGAIDGVPKSSGVVVRPVVGPTNPFQFLKMAVKARCCALRPAGVVRAQAHIIKDRVAETPCWVYFTVL